ncbi:MAG: leucine--tRNA ligase [Deltaproteobacteria bacterium]|nr:leucine--tRNA ligase [Deltaproteobacteria bacterium]MBW2394593.1 leucine--tRNA ligase [Deltaproteobacteria bacterium]
MAYEPKTIEARWQRYWLENETFRCEVDPSRPKYYVLDMFPYPSGQGLHVGHPKGYISTDAIARYKRMRGFNVLHPMGWDAFGLPAEQHAVETGTHPAITTQRNIDTYRRQLRSLGLSYDWSREIDTTDPRYVRWTQWIFQKLHERGLAYEAEVAVNWCSALGTVLANEEVIDGKSERGGHPVVRMPMRQWMLRITEYAERLLADLDDLDWPERIKRMQVEWIGRSEGARVSFPIVDGDKTIEVFTTRPDTLFGATYMVLAPEHPLVQKLTTEAQRGEVEAYVAEAARKSDRLRMAEGDDKTGVFTGAFAINPVNDARIPVWIADYVLATYGTGAIMAVPGHDERDYAFATKFDLPILEVVAGGNVAEAAFTGHGTAVNSGFLDRLPTQEAKTRMNAWLEDQGKGEATINYKLRDWLFSRQRYWGEPFPVMHLEDGTIKLVPEDQLPVTLPELDDWAPTGEFETPLSRVPEWIETSDPATGAKARRDPNTMPQWAGSCWYYLRFCDPRNDAEAWSQEALDYWMPVDLYVGGAEHAVLHLLYARFWHKVLYDCGLVSTKEPFQKLLNPGMILGYAYRYYDDNLSDDPDARPHAYPSSAVRIDGETAVAMATGEEVKARWLMQDAVRWSEDHEPLHPTLDDLPLEEVTEKMSKSRGNVVSPDDVIDEFGADAMRLYELFMGPLEKGAPWSTDGIPGCFRFLQRAYRLVMEEELAPGDGTQEQARLTAKTIAGVTKDMEAIQPNTAISKLMVWSRDISRDAPAPRAGTLAFVKMLAPFAPHLAEELWSHLGHTDSLTYESWPEADASQLIEDTITLAVQVNGKRRDEIQVPADSDEAAVRSAALASESVRRHMDGKEPRKVIVVPGRLVNIVV